TSARLVRAAQTNGKKSRGPVTSAGKLKSSANSRTHGLYSKSLQPDAECETEYQHRLAALKAEFRPETPFARNLVETVARAVAQEHWVSRIAVTIVNNEIKNSETNRNSP